MYGSETRSGGQSSIPGMAPRLALPLLLLILADIPVAAQFGSPFPGAGGTGYPGSQGTGYPGGGGIQLPGRRRNTANQPTEQLSGKLQRISTSQLVLDPGDGRNITIAIDRNTKYISNSGGTGRYGDFDTGDEVSIDAARDNQNFYHGLRVSLIRKGTPGDVSDAKSSTSEGSSNSSSRSASNNGASNNDDPDRPVLKRAGSSGNSVRRQFRCRVMPPFRHATPDAQGADHYSRRRSNGNAQTAVDNC